MGSSEEYLDSLLRSMEQKETGDIEDMTSSFDVNTSEEAFSEEDIESMLSDAMKDEAIQEINELLYKNDNGEIIIPDDETPYEDEGEVTPQELLFDAGKEKKENKKPTERKGLFSRLSRGRKKAKIEEEIVEESILEEPVIEESVIEESVIEEPIIDEPVIEEPIIEESIIEEPLVEEPSGEQSEDTLDNFFDIPAEENSDFETDSVSDDIATEGFETGLDSLFEEPSTEEIPIEESELEEIAIEETPEETLIEESPIDNPTVEDLVVEEQATEEALDEEIDYSQMLIPAADEEQELRTDPDDVDLDEGLAELLDMAGVTEDDFNGQVDDDASPAPVADFSEEESQDAAIDSVFDETDATESAEGITEESSTSNDETSSDDMESLLFSSFEEAGENASTVSDAEMGAIDDLFGNIDSDNIESTEGAETVTEEESEAKPKKKGLLSKIAEFLTESDDDDEEEEPKKKKKKGKKGEPEESSEVNPDAEGATTDENKEVNRQLDEEEEEGKKKKKKKKRKKGEPEGAEELEEREPHEKQAGKGDSEEEEENSDDGKKKKKPKKEKKAKAPKPVDDKPLPKLSKKKVRVTFLFAITILAGIIALVIFGGNLASLQKARSAYYNGEYELCYKKMYGRKLSDGDKIMFEKAKILLVIDRDEEKYNEYMAIGDEYRALDSLLSAVATHSILMEKATTLGFDYEASQAYTRILSLLENKYGITEDKAIEINSIEMDAVYTLYIKSVVDHTEFVLPEYLESDYVSNRVNEIMNSSN